MRPLIVAAGVALVSLGMSFGQPTFAAADKTAAEAFPEQLERASADFQAGRFGDSLVELQRAYDLNPMPRLHYNMSKCYEQLGQPAEELRQLEMFLATDPDLQKDEALKTRVADRIATLRHTLGLDRRAAVSSERPLHKRWWLWTIVGTVAAGSAVGVTMGVLAAQGPGSQQGTQINPQWTLPSVQTATFQLRWK